MPKYPPLHFQKLQHSDSEGFKELDKDINKEFHHNSILIDNQHQNFEYQVSNKDRHPVLY